MSPFRPELDLSGILPSYFKRQADDTSDPAEEYLGEDGIKYPNPVIIGAAGTEVWSTCVQLAVRIVLKWDVNGYYKALGVHPDATRRELMQAYLAKDGQSSTRLTYCFKQLLNPVTRAAYDATPLGEPFLDEYTQAEIKQNAAREAMKSTQMGRAMTAEDVMDEWGYTLEEEVDEQSPLEPLHHTTNTQPFPWMVYAWQTKRHIPDQERMADWQSILVSQAAEMGIIKEVAIGTTALATEDILVETDAADRPIFYLNEDVVITDELAKDALKRAFAK